MGYIKEIQIPIDKPYKKVPIHAKQNDYNSRFFHVILTNNGENLTAADLGTVEKVAIGITRGDGKQKAFKGEHIVSDCSFSLPLPQWGLERANDTIKCDVMIWGKNANGEDYLIRSALVSVFVEKSAFNSDTIEDAESFDILKELIEKAEYCHTEVLKSQQIVEAAQMAAESAAAQAQEWAESINPAELARKEELKAVEEKVDLHEQRIDKSLGKQAQTIVCPHEACITGSGDEAFLDIDDGYVTVDKIHGKTVKCDNLLELNNGTYTIFGVSITINNGNVTIKGTATGSGGRNTRLSKNFMLPAGNYMFTSYFPNGHISNASNTTHIAQVNNAKAFTLTEATEVYFGINTIEGTTYDATYNFMLNIGTEAKPYSKWFAGLKNAKFKGITSTGRNLIPYPYHDGNSKTFNGITYTVNTDGSVTANGTATAQSWFFLASNVSFSAGEYFLSGVPNNPGEGISIYFSNTNYSLYCQDKGNGFSFSLKKQYDDISIVINFQPGAIANNLVFRPILNIGNSVLPYEPYHADTSFAFAEPQDNGEWNTLNITTGKIEKQWAEKVFDGTETWYPSSINGYYAYYTKLTPNGASPLSFIENQGLIYSYPGAPGNSLGMGCYISNADYDAFLVWANQDNYPNLSTSTGFKAWLAALAAAGNPLTVRYKTAEVTETDLPSIPTNKYAVVKSGMQYVDAGMADSPYAYGAYNTIIKNYGVDPIGQIFYNADMNKSQQTEIDALKADKQDVLTFDDTPTEESANPVTSGGIRAVLEEKADKTALAKLAAEVADNRNILREAKVFTVATVEDTYTVRETAGGEPNLIDGSLTAVKEICGKTVKTENLLPYPYHNNSKTENGVTFTVNDDQTVTANGTATANTAFYLLYKRESSTFVAGNTYHISGCPAGGSYSTYFIQLSDDTVGSKSDYGEGVSYTLQSNNIRLSITIQVGATVNNLVFRPMLVAGTEAKPYSKWFASLKNAFFKEIVSTGKNLLAYPYPNTTKVEEGLSWTDNGDGTINVSGTATAHSAFRFTDFNINLSGEFTTGRIPDDVDLAYFVRLRDYNGNDIASFINKQITFNTATYSNFSYFVVSIMASKFNVFIKDTKLYPMLNYGATATAYEPYISDTLSAATPIELAEYDVAYPETGETKRQSKTLTFDGTEYFGNYSTTEYYIYTVSINPYGFIYNGGVANNGFIFTNPNPDNEKGCYIAGYQKDTFNIWFKKTVFPEFDTLDKFKAWLTAQYAAGDPLTVTYKTAEATTEATPFNKSKYIAWKNGSETQVPGATDNTEYGAITTVKQEYSKLIPKEEV